ncbi:MAG: SMC-Scp complex subunit ScpB [Alphaproteobacteria bacterium]|nr:SMC-Scp complex subunit ScpB [Alphaproteobacteria bacterium]
MRRIEEAFAEAPTDTGGDDPHLPSAVEEPRAGPSEDAIRAAEALIFASGTPMTEKQLSEKLGPDVDVEAVLLTLKRRYQGGVLLMEAGGAWRFQTAPDLAGLFAEKRTEPKKLPRAALETLAVIAYHQPATRAEIEDIRGVSLARGSLDLLIEIGWVRPRGRRRSPGRPLTFGTTDAFLAHFGLSGLDSLPGKEDLKALGLLEGRAAADIEVPRPSDEPAPDEEPLSADGDGEGFFVDHLSDKDD